VIRDRNQSGHIGDGLRRETAAAMNELRHHACQDDAEGAHLFDGERLVVPLEPVLVALQLIVPLVEVHMPQLFSRTDDSLLHFACDPVNRARRAAKVFL
jgi:hypothetical protein